MLSEIFTTWLRRRGITESVIRDFKLEVCDHQYLDGCLKIPVFNENGDIIFAKYRRSPIDDRTPKYVYDKGSEVSLYGWNKARDAKRIFITEGEMDCLVAWSANIPAVTSTGGAMSFQPDWAGLFADKEVIVCFDNDEAGGKGLVRLLRIIPHAKIVFLPDRPGIKDISDYVGAGGDLHSLIESAKHYENEADVRADMSERNALWRSTYFHDAYIAEKEKERAKPKPLSARRRAGGEIDDDMIAQAKAYPIEKLIELKARKRCCLWHSEDTPSLHLHHENRLWCYGKCYRGYDAIDVYMKLHGASFVEAVKILAGNLHKV